MSTPSISTSTPGSPRITVTLSRETSPEDRRAIQRSVEEALRGLATPTTTAAAEITKATVLTAQPAAKVVVRDPATQEAANAGVAPNIGPKGVASLPIVGPVLSYVFGWTYREPIDRRLEEIITSLPVRKENGPLFKIASDFNALFRELQPLIRSAMMARDVSLWYQVQANEDPDVFRAAYDAAVKAQGLMRKKYTPDLVEKIVKLHEAIEAEYKRASQARYNGTDEVKRSAEESYTLCRIYSELLKSLGTKLDTRYRELKEVKSFPENLNPIKQDPLGEASQAKLISDLLALYDEILTTKEWFEALVPVLRALPYYENRTSFVTPVTELVRQQYDPLTRNVEAQRASVDRAIKALLQISKDSEPKAKAVDGQLALLKALSERIKFRYSEGGWVNSWAITQAYAEIVNTAKSMQDQFPKS